jgi:hypothetical protein
VAALAALSTVAGAQVEQYEGRPTFAEDTELGYYVWFEDGAWKVRWSTLGTMRVFAGLVEAEGGKVKSLKRVDVETETRYFPGRTTRVVTGPRGRTHVRRGPGPVAVSREQDRIEKDGDSKITFTARTDDIDGFDFKVDENTTSLRFILEVNGRPVPNRVEAGKGNYKPGAMPLIVKLK